MASTGDEGLEEYQIEANALKDKGNDAFQAGDIDAAIRYFSQAIDIDPDNHVLFSNRSAAYMKADSISKALWDAEKCVSLAPQWPKGYSRLGAAQQSLKRFDAAIDSFKKGIELDPNSKPLWTALRICQDAFEADKKQRFQAAQRERDLEAERLRRRDEIREEMTRERRAVEQENELAAFLSEVADSKPKTEDVNTSSTPEDPVDSAEQDDALADFFSEVSAVKPAERKPPAPPVVSAEFEGSDALPLGAESGETEEVVTLTEKYTKQDLGSGEEQCARLLANHHEWKNLNPYYVLQLDIDANVEDIKFRYKKLSLKVHPDRMREIENARVAFEYVKEAYNRLLDEDQRRTISMHIENVTTDLKRERKRLLAKGVREADLPDYEESRSIELMKHFGKLEQMKRLSDKNRRAYGAREKQQEQDELEKLEKFNEFDKEWSQDNRRDKRVGNWRDFQHDPGSKKSKVSNFKEEHRAETKHGVVKLEEWKKNWK